VLGTGRLDCALKLPKLYFEIVERRSDDLDFGHSELSMLIFFAPFFFSF